MKTVLLLLGTAALVYGQLPPQVNLPSGIQGVVTVSPVHGGPTRIGVPNSKPLANTEFEIKNGEQVVASFSTNEDGTFRVLLPPGHYTVVKKNTQKGIGRYGPFEVVVAAGEMTKVEWNCDSGMR